MKEVVRWYDYAFGAVCLAVCWAVGIITGFFWFGKQ